MRGDGVIPRYSMPEMAALWTDEARLAGWLEVELSAAEGWAEVGALPAADAAALRQRAPVVDAGLVAAVAEREAVTDHDVAAFVDVVQAAIGGSEAGWVHYGLTSSDVVDTALGATLAASADLLIEASSGLVAALKRRALEFRDTPMLGRTHGMHAEPTTFGAKLALWCLQADRDRQRLRAARQAVAVGKLSGAVGTYSNIDPRVEDHVCGRLGLRAVPSTQVVARDRHAEYLWACAASGASVELMATEIRHLQRSEVAEVREPFRAGQKGSSAMPHKRNPITCERLSGLARLLRGYLGAGLENVALWHERDISHSSVERVALPDASLLAYYVLRRMTAVIDGLEVDAGRMRENLDAAHGLVFSQPVLLALVAGGMSRDTAYRVVQRNALAAFEQGKDLRTLLEGDPEVTVAAQGLDEAFDLGRSLRHAGRVFEHLQPVNESSP
ncbi:MAG: adenylosuccinate lyase [Acidimicrobiales bacterium]